MKTLINKIVSSAVVIALLLNAVPFSTATAAPFEYNKGDLNGYNKEDLVVREYFQETSLSAKDPRIIQYQIRTSSLLGMHMTASVTKDSHIVASPNKKIEFEFQSVSKDFIFTLNPVKNAPAADPKNGIAGNAFRAGASSKPHGSINIYFNYSDADIWGLEEDTVSLYIFDQETSSWSRLPTTLEKDKNRLVAITDTLGIFAAFGRLSLYAAPGDAFRLVLDPDDDVGHAYWAGVGTVTELPYNVNLAKAVRDRFVADGCNVEILLTRESANPDYLSRTNRANQAIDFGADMFVTFAFNALYGTGWGYEGNGGVEAWARSGHPADDALATQFFNNITTYTGRPHRKPILHPSKYSEFNALPSDMTYAHVEAMFLDHYFDWAVISDGFESIVEASYASIWNELSAKGMTCVGGPGGNGLPRPPSAEMLKRLRNLGYQNYQRYILDPVSASTGNHATSRKLFSLPGPDSFDLNFTLVYNSQDDREGLFGVGWASPIAYTQLYSDDSVSVTLFDGRTYYYLPNGSGYESPEDVPATLERTDDGWLWTDTDGTTLTFVESKRGLGVLTEIRERHGKTQTYEYDFDQTTSSGWPMLLTVTDSVGRIINFETTDGYVTKITLPDGRTFRFTYVDGNLTEITDAKNQTYRYEYDDQKRMVKEWDPQGILFLQNFYDDRDRIIRQLDADDSEGKVDYSPDFAVYTDNLGNETRYNYDDQSRVTSVVDALGFTISYVYDEKDNIVQFTDARGNTFTYTYDDHLNLLTESGPENYYVEYSYNEFDDLLSVKDLGGRNGHSRVTRFVVNQFGDIEEIEYPDGSRVLMRYDSLGNLVSFTDENGNTTEYQYDNLGNRIKVTDPLSLVTRYEYDNSGRLLKVTDALLNVVEFGYDNNNNIVFIKDSKGGISQFEYDANDNLVKMTDRRGGRWLFGYDRNLKLVSETDPGGHTTYYGYDLMYNLTDVTDPRGNKTRYVYNARYEVEKTIAANGGETHFTYDPNGNPIQAVNAVGAVTTFEYDGLNRLIAQTDAENGSTEFIYDEVGRLVKQTNPRGAQTLYDYDLRDRLVETRDALNGTWKIEYDAAGNPVLFVDANGHETHLGYDKVNRPTKTIDAEGNETTFTLDGVGNLLSTRDALGRVTSYGYDANNNLVEIVDALSHVTTFVYDEEDNLISITDARNNTTSFEYGLDGLLIRMIEAGGQASLYEYDGAHNLTRFTNAKGRSWVFGYNELNLLSSETNPLGAATQYEYDLAGRMIRTTDANQVATRYAYDGLNRLVAVIQNERPGPSNFETNVGISYGYDEVGNLITIRDANGHETFFEYDLLDRLIVETNALGDSWKYSYDAVGNLVTRTDANNNRTTYDYTANDLLESVTYPNRTGIEYSYDAVGNQLGADSSWLGPITNEYDELNRLIASTDHQGNTIRYGYDNVGNQTSVIYPDGKKAAYEYDSTNYLVKMTDPAGNVFAVTRDATHNTSLIKYPNQTVAKYFYDVADQLKVVENARTSGTILSRFMYELDAVGNRVKTTETYWKGKPVTTVTDYGYDPLYRLVSSHDSMGLYSNYSYDAVGNRTSLVTNVDPTLGQQRANLTYEYSYNEINALMNITKGSATRDLTKVSAQLRAFIAEVNAQSGKGIEKDTATVLIQSATALQNQVNTGAPSIETVEAALASLEEQVKDAYKARKIKTAGLMNSLLAKLKSARNENQNSKPQNGDTQTYQYEYDENGNRTSLFASDPKNKNQGTKTIYEYDFENRLNHVVDYINVTGNGNGNGQVRGESEMTFDAYGRLFERRYDHHAGGAGDQSATQFVYDGLDPVVERYQPSGQYTNLYRGDGRILSMLTNAGAGYASGRAEYFHYDGLNSVVDLTNHLGQSAHSYQYSDFGTILDNNGHAQDASNFTDPHNHYTYTGQEWDERTGLFHFYAREYDPFTGTWLQQDHFRGHVDEPFMLHRYSYVGNNPTTTYDYLGHFVDYLIDGAFIAADIYEFKKNPSVFNGVMLGVDVALAALPFVPAGAGAGVRGVKAASKSAKVANTLTDTARSLSAKKLFPTFNLAIDSLKNSSKVTDTSRFRKPLESFKDLVLRDYASYQRQYSKMRGGMGSQSLDHIIPKSWFYNNRFLKNLDPNSAAARALSKIINSPWINLYEVSRSFNTWKGASWWKTGLQITGLTGTISTMYGIIKGITNKFLQYQLSNGAYSLSDFQRTHIYGTRFTAYRKK